MKNEVVRRLPIMQTDVSGVISSSLLSCGPGHLVLLEKGRFGYDDKKNITSVIDRIDLDGFFRWVRANPNSDLVKAEKAAAICDQADPVCEKWGSELANLAPTGGALQSSESSDDNDVYGQVDDVIRYSELFEQNIKGQNLRRPALEIDVEVYSAPDYSGSKDYSGFNRAVSEVLIKSIRQVDVDNHGNEKKTVIFASKSAVHSAYRSCIPAKIPR